MSFSSEEIKLKGVEKALEEGEYEKAIDDCQEIIQNSDDPRLLSLAKRSLISAYQNSGKIKKAIELCQQLQNTGELHDQVWATTQLNRLNQRENPLNIAGFVADSPPTSPPAKKKPIIETPKPPKETIIQQPKPETPIPTLTHQWNNAPKAIKWQPLKTPSLSNLWRRIYLGLVLFFVLFDASIKVFMEVTNAILVSLPHIRPFQPFYRDPTWVLIIFVGIMFIISPWFLTLILRRIYQGERLPLYKFNARCPLTGKRIQSYCRQKKVSLPTLEIIAENAPFIFSYGHGFKRGHIVVSEGLLKKLNDEEVAVLFAGEMGMFHHFPFVILSGLTAFLQIPYTLYFQITFWGEKLYDYLPKEPPRFIPNFLWRDIPPLVRNSAAMLGGLFYLAYRLWKLPLNIVFQGQHFDRDYLSISLTGDPNAKVRGLIKIALGITEETIDNEKPTSWLVAGFSMISPLDYHQGLYLGSLSRHLSLKEILDQESSQPHRHQLNLLQSHPLISDRIFNLLQWAKKSRLPLELEINPPPTTKKTFRQKLTTLLRLYEILPLLQKSLLVGVTLGMILRLILWGIGILSNQLDIIIFVWFAEAESFLSACILFIFSLSIILGINHYFPNLRISSANNNPSLYRWLTDTEHPQQVRSLRISGKLLGRSGISHWLGQDLILKTETGMIFLHVSSRLGIIGNLLPQFPRANKFVNQGVIVSGWLRGGMIPWLDVERITNEKRQSLQADYPLWLTLVAMMAAVWGTGLVLDG